MQKVKYMGCNDAQVHYGGHHDPRKHLEVGQIYNLVRQEVESWSTEYFLEGFESYGFNSVCFEIVDETGPNEHSFRFQLPMYQNTTVSDNGLNCPLEMDGKQLKGGHQPYRESRIERIY